MTRHMLEWLPAYRDGELNPGLREMVEAHLQTCPDCQRELRALESLAAMLKTDRLPDITPAERFAAQVQLRLPRSTRPAARSSQQDHPRWVLGTALALIGAWAILQAALFIAVIFLNAEWIFNLPDLGGIPFEAVSSGLLGITGSLLLINLGLLVVTTIFWGLWLSFWIAWKNNQSLEGASSQI